jgi:hypothetical protein
MLSIDAIDCANRGTIAIAPSFAGFEAPERAGIGGLGHEARHKFPRGFSDSARIRAASAVRV